MTRLALAALALATLSPEAPAFDPEFHFHATYVLAREAGIAEDEALAIAGGAWSVDSPLDAGELSSIRPLLRAGVMAVALPTLVWPIVFAVVGEYDGAADWFGKISDVVISPAAVAVHFPTEGGQRRVTPYTGQAGHRAGGMVALAFGARDPVLLGIALHSVQDSWSHSGHLPASHLGTMLLVDTLATPTSRNRARGAMWQTWRILSAWAAPGAEPDRWPLLREKIDSWFRRVRDGEDRTAVLYAILPPGAAIPEAGTPATFERARERLVAWIDSGS